ncbi:hypothetical protein AS361_01820 [Myroides marinus]|uniref:lectin-like domain-containing protein n=1 Tax=Myroides marinus TaxID=703342 RepID=UPI0007419D16|nr:hypothetical protein [Myroides marinus]KUF39343.1 hypothetical protein AS361_01820 [Myroides marinus]
MRKKVLFGYSKIYYCLLILLFNQLCLGQNKFPYFNTGQSEQGFIKIDAKTNDLPTPNLITFSPDGIKLVDGGSQQAAVALDALSFSTDKGFILEFEFGLDLGSSNPGDGIAMVLFDASITTPAMGVKGSGLGYAHARRTTGGHLKGFLGGFLGLGLDLYGNYKNVMSDTKETRNGIIDGKDEPSGTGGGNYVVLRGPAGPLNTEGYPVLFGINTNVNSNYYLDKSSGDREKRQKGFEGQRFEIKGGKHNVGPGDPAYRKAIISLVKGKDDVNNSTDGFFISVDMLHGVYKSSVIKNYFIPTTGTIRYRELVTAGSTTVTTKTLAISVPTELKMAFTGSTGGASIRAHIRNIALSLPFSPVANDMSVQGVLVDAPSTIKPLYLAFGYNSNVYSVLNPPIKSFLYLEKKSFRFKRYDPVSKQPVLTPDSYTLNEPGTGIFKYDENTGEITFTPETGFQGDVPYTFYYDIKNVKPASGTDISTEEYRSRTAAITLNFVKKGTGVDAYPTIIVNRGLKNTKELKP